MGRRNLQRLLRQVQAWNAQVRSISTSSSNTTLPGLKQGSLKQRADEILSFQQTRGNAALAQTVTKVGTAVHVHVPAVRTDLVGAVSVVSQGEQVQEGVFKNIDGHRHEDGRYARFMEEISGFIPKERQLTDPVRTFAYGTDASFYRLNPR